WASQSVRAFPSRGGGPKGPVLSVFACDDARGADWVAGGAFDENWRSHSFVASGVLPFAVDDEFGAGCCCDCDAAEPSCDAAAKLPGVEPLTRSNSAFILSALSRMTRARRRFGVSESARS